MIIPSQTLWTKTNQGDTLGVLGDVQNVSLDVPGKLLGTKKAVSVMSSAVDGDFRTIVSTVYFDDKYIAVGTNGLFGGLLNGDTFLQNVSFTPAVTVNSDAVVFNNLLYVTIDNNMESWDGDSTIVTSIKSLTTSVPHPLAVYGAQLAVGNGNQVALLNTSNVTTITLALPSNFEVTTIRSRNDFLYIGTREKYGGEAMVFLWDGNTTLFNYAIPVGAPWVYSMTEYDSSVVCLTSQGQLLYISGTSTQELAAFPIYHRPSARWLGSNKVYNRGMITVGKTIYINVDGTTDGMFVPEMKSGLWVYDPDVGLYHKAYSSTDVTVKDTGLSVADSVITTSAAHNLITGDVVNFQSVSGLTGITTATNYYVTVLSTTTIKLSLTREAVEQETYVQIGGTAGASDILIYFPNTDYGSSVAGTGAILQTVYNTSPLLIMESEVMWASQTVNNSNTTVYTLNVLSDQYNVSTWETQRIYSDNLTQNWKEVAYFLDGLKNSNEQFAPYIITESSKNQQVITGVWSTTNILQTNTTSQTNAWATIEVGDMIVFRERHAQGRRAFVTAIENSSTVYQLTLDQSFGVANRTSNFYVVKAKKITDFTGDKNTDDYLVPSLFGANSSWIKLGAIMQGYQIGVDRLNLSHGIKSNVK